MATSFQVTNKEFLVYVDDPNKIDEGLRTRITYYLSDGLNSKILITEIEERQPDEMPTAAELTADEQAIVNAANTP